MSIFVVPLMVIVSGYFFLCLLFYGLQTKLIFIGAFPDEVQEAVWKKQSIKWQINNAELEGWHIENKQASKGVIFYFGGNAENVIECRVDNTYF